MTDGNNTTSESPVYVDPQTGQPVQQPVVDPATGHAMVRATDASGQLVQYPVDPTTGQAAGEPVVVEPADGSSASTGSDTNESFGFREAPVQEKYNTEYIVNSMNKNTRTNQFIVIGVVIAALLGAAMWAMLAPKSEPPKLPQSNSEAPDAPNTESDAKSAE